MSVVTEAVKLTQNNGGAERVVELAQRALDGHERFAAQGMAVGSRRSVWHQREHVVVAVWQTVSAFAVPPLQPRETFVHRDAKQPSADRSVTTERGKARQHPLPCRLRGILGVFTVPHHPQREAIDRSALQVDERLPGVDPVVRIVAALQASEQIVFVGGHSAVREDQYPALSPHTKGFPRVTPFDRFPNGKFPARSGNNRAAPGLSD